MGASESLTILNKFLQFPSISTQPEHKGDMLACAEWLKGCCEDWGLDAEVYPTEGHPVVVARYGNDLDKKTVLIYGHYDVQPPEPLEEWETPPFEPSEREGRIYARGSSDNKGQILAHLLGVAQALKEEGSLPVNVVFLIEGEEEIGSPSLEKFMEAHREILRCDVIVISDTEMVAPGVPTVTYGLRGITALEFKVTGPSHDLHSGSYGGAVMNPATAVARLIASLHDGEGRVAVPGFYEDVRPIQDWEKEAQAQIEGFEDDLKKTAGVDTLFGEKGFSPIEQIGARPTAEVNGMGGGYQGEGTKTVLPKSAFAKLTFRLVPDQDPEKILDLVEAHLRTHLPKGVALEVERGHSGKAFLGDPQTPYGQSAVRAMEKVFPHPAVFIRAGGSIPIVDSFQHIFGVDVLLLGLANSDCLAHAPNENFLIENFMQGIRLNQVLLREIGED